MTISLVDSTIFCELLQVPNKSSDYKTYRSEFELKVEEGELLFLPTTTLIETGNHIGQNGNGYERREAALRFVDYVGDALRGDSPFTPLRFLDRDDLEKWLADFPSWVQQSSGLGDLSIVKEFEHQCALFPARRVYIWSKDKHLAGHDRRP